MQIAFLQSVLELRDTDIPSLPGGSVVKKNPPANAGGVGLISGPGRFPGEGNGNPH